MIEEEIFRQMRKMREEMDKMMGSIFSERKLLPGKNLAEYRQAVSDLSESKEKFTAKIELPGIKKEDINVNITDNSVEIRAKTGKEKEEKKKGSYYYEKNYSGFYKFMTLPSEIKKDSAKADYKDGILTIEMPKKEAKIEKKESKKLKVL